jgi:putative membrane protein
MLSCLKVKDLKQMQTFRNQTKFQLSFMAICLFATYIGCKDLPTWFLETFPVMIGILLILLTEKRFPLTPLVGYVICIHSLILSVGGHYTYAEVPLGFWMERTFHFTRTHYDRIGHFAQGFMPALLAREIFIRRNIVNGHWWRFYIVTSVCLAFSAFYEFIEWWTALINGEGATAFLGTQGDIWDTQWDMFFALVGAVVAQAVMTKWHNHQIRNLAVTRVDQSKMGASQLN